jgi:hypothetical protein
LDTLCGALLKCLNQNAVVVLTFSFDSTLDSCHTACALHCTSVTSADNRKTKQPAAAVFRCANLRENAAKRSQSFWQSKAFSESSCCRWSKRCCSAASCQRRLRGGASKIKEADAQERQGSALGCSLINCFLTRIAAVGSRRHRPLETARVEAR